MKYFSTLDLGTNTFGLNHFKGFEITSTASDHDVFDFVNAIKSEDCIHSWKNMNFQNSQYFLQDLVQFENTKRPTEIFFYYGVNHQDERILVGAATVALKISNNFKHEGFPVLARCYIKQEYRNLRLYFPILKHRFDYCKNILGNNLRGIHLGSANPRVFNVIKKNVFGIPFCYLGDEYLSLNQNDSRVHDYLWLSAPLIKELLEIKSQLKEKCDGYQNLISNIQSLVENKYTTSGYHELLNSIATTKLESNWDPKQSNMALKQILDFMEAIPLINESISMDQELDFYITRAA